MIKIPIQKSQEVQSIPQNGHKSNVSVKPFKGVPTTSLQERRVNNSGLNHVELKRESYITSDGQINNTQSSQSSKSSDT